ncbi:MAG: carbohydrate ABC transporter permease [Bacillota bacterium]
MKLRILFKRAAFWLFLCALASVFVMPYLFMITNSFEEFSYVLPYPPKIFPASLNFAAYEYVLTKANLPQAVMNSLIITLGTVLLVVLVSSLSAYGFARIEFFGRETLFKLYLFTLMVPGFLSIIPQVLVLQSIRIPGLTAATGLVGTRMGLILLYVGTGICGNTFFLRGHFAALPRELEESVYIDGGGHAVTFFRVMLPLMLPSVATLAIFCFQGTWEEFFTAKVVLGGVRQNITLPLMIQTLRGQHATRWEWIFAASILAQLPILLLFVLFQKRFVVSGLSEGSVKA